MRTGWIAVLAGLVLGAGAPATIAAPAQDWAIALHGEAGVIERGSMTPEAEAAARLALSQALKVGEDVLAAGGTAVEAVEASIRVMEEHPQFNAGHGAVFTSAGTIELDAAFMDGRTLASGAVTGVTTARSPISLARTLMTAGPHVFLSGEAADRYASANGLEQVPNSFFMTERRKKQLDDLKLQGQGASLSPEMRFGTVGAVARDKAGNLAAATSTGGLIGKAPGRIGDAPVIGAGTIADNRACAVSGTGSGEIFIRTRIAGQICDRARFGGQPLQAAADAAIAELGALNGSGGVIVLGPRGEGLFSMNSAGKYRARASAAGVRSIAIYADER